MTQSNEATSSAKTKFKLTQTEEREVIEFVKELRESKVSRKEVSLAVCKSLFFDYGVQPTANLIYTLTKFGSMTDVGEDIKVFWSKLRQTSKITFDAKGVPEEVQTAYGEQLSLLWLKVVELANQNFEEEKSRLTDDANKLFNDLTQTQAISLIYENRASTAEDKAEQLSKTLKQREQIAHDAQVETQELIKQLKAANAQLQSDLTEARAQFAKELAAERTLRSENDQYANAERNRLMQEIDNTRIHYEKIIASKDTTIKQSSALVSKLSPKK